MNDTEPRKVPEWETETLEARLYKCARMLYLHGCISEAEKPRIAKRIWKAVNHD